jgi:hypothetical protein
MGLTLVKETDYPVPGDLIQIVNPKHIMHGSIAEVKKVEFSKWSSTFLVSVQGPPQSKYHTSPGIYGLEYIDFETMFTL